MSNDSKPDLLDWLGLRSTPVYSVARWLGPLVSMVAILLILLAIAAAFMVLIRAVFLGLPATAGGGLGTGAVAVALIGAPFVIWRSIVAQKTVEVQEQGQITDRINKAVEGLGAEKVVKRDGKEFTQPNLEVRIGAIYALERIAQDSDRDHVQIMEILCAYIRQNAPAPEADDWPVLEMKKGEGDGPLEADWGERLEAFREAQNLAKAKLKLREDIQVALTVIGRRSDKQRRLEAGRGVEAEFVFDRPCPDYDGQEGGHDPDALAEYKARLTGWRRHLEGYQGYRLDLRQTNLRGADLSRLNLAGARLEDSHLEGADLSWAKMQGADLRGAKMQGADLRGAKMQGADLSGAKMQGADLRGAKMQGADLRGAKMQGADLRGAKMQGADLSGAEMQGAVLRWAEMQGAVLRWAEMQGAVLRWAEMQGADLSGAEMQGAVLSGAEMQGAVLRWAEMQGAVLRWAEFDSDTNLTAATLRGAAVRLVDFTDIAQINTYVPDIFGDATVTLPGGFGPKDKGWPDHWSRKELNVHEFDKQWRDWQAGLTEDKEG